MISQIVCNIPKNSSSTFVRSFQRLTLWSIPYPLLIREVLMTDVILCLTRFGKENSRTDAPCLRAYIPDVTLAYEYRTQHLIIDTDRMLLTRAETWVIICNLYEGCPCSLPNALVFIISHPCCSCVLLCDAVCMHSSASITSCFLLRPYEVSENLTVIFIIEMSLRLVSLSCDHSFRFNQQYELTNLFLYILLLWGICVQKSSYRSSTYDAGNFLSASRYQGRKRGRLHCSHKSTVFSYVNISLGAISDS